MQKTARSLRMNSVQAMCVKCGHEYGEGIPWVQSYFAWKSPVFENFYWKFRFHKSRVSVGGAGPPADPPIGTLWSFSTWFRQNREHRDQDTAHRKGLRFGHAQYHKSTHLWKFTKKTGKSEWVSFSILETAKRSDFPKHQHWSTFWFFWLFGGFSKGPHKPQICHFYLPFTLFGGLHINVKEGSNKG